MKRNFLLVIGAVKAGTTTLYEILRFHRNVIIASVKETNFFLDEENWSLEFYLRNFFPCRRTGIYCDVDPRYLYFEIAPRKIKELLKDNVKFVVVLRNPVDRAISHYFMDWRNGEIDIPFEQAVEFELKNIDFRKKNPGRTRLNYIQWSLYSRYIRRYLSLFGRDKFLFLLFERDIKKNLREGVSKIIEFANLDLNGLEISDFNVKANVAYEPRIRVINKLIAHPFVSKISGLFLPSRRLRRKVKFAIENLNRRREIQIEIPKEIKISLMNKVFNKDIEELQKLTGLDLSFWYEGVK